MSVPDPIHLPRPGVVTRPAPEPNPLAFAAQMETAPVRCGVDQADPEEEK